MYLCAPNSVGKKIQIPGTLRVKVSFPGHRAELWEESEYADSEPWV